MNGILHKSIFIIVFTAIATQAIAPAASLQSESELFTITFTSAAGNFTYTDRPVIPTDYLVADEINTRGINASIKEKRATMSRVLRAGASYERAVTYCMPKLAAVVERAEKAIYVAPTDAELQFRPDGAPPFTIIREKSGRELDVERTYSLVYAAVVRGKSAIVPLPVAEISALVTADELRARTYNRSDFFTEFSDESPDRAHNIALALSRINGMVLESGEEFSFNRTVGSRTAEAGFREAKIIVGGDYVLGYGGGVCQASTTLYNAALMAGMEITAVRNHSLTAGYVPPSMDAMVNSGSSDLKFRNPLGTPVYLAAGTSGGKAFVRFYGEKNEFDIVLKSVVLKTIPRGDDERIIDYEHKYFPPQTNSGECMRIREGKDGVTSEGWAEYYRRGAFVRRIKLRTDSYAVLKGITVVAP